MPRLRLLPPVEEATTAEEAAPIMEYLMRRGGNIAIDTETTGLNKIDDRVLYWSMSTESRRFFFPSQLLGFFDPLFRRRDLSWYFANNKFDRHMLMNMGYQILGRCLDIVDMDAMVDDTRPHGLKEQAWLGYQAKWGEFKETFLDPFVVGEELMLDKVTLAEFKGMENRDKLHFVHNERPDLLANYCSADSYFTYIRAEDLVVELDDAVLPTQMVPELKTLKDYYEIIEVPLSTTLFRMERTGVHIDQDWVKKIDGPIRDGIAAKKAKLYKIIGYEFNPRSNDELGQILFSKNEGFNLKPVRYTSGGKGEPKPSVDENTLNTLRQHCEEGTYQYEFIDTLLELKKLNKLHSTYVNGLRHQSLFTGTEGKKNYICSDGKVHCRFNQSGARTSRLSSSDPNTQNIPIRGDVYGIRGCFVAGPGELLVDLDYPQIEFRIAAGLSGEEAMMEAIKKGWDIHSANAANMYKADARVTYKAIMESRKKKDNKLLLSDVEKYLLTRRDGAKTVGLGALYGEGKTKMAKSLGIKPEEAEEIIETFFETNPKIKGLIDHMHDYGHKYEITHTMLGRIRRLYKINNEYNPGLVAAEERQAWNTLIQGSGAEMLKLAMLQIDNNPEFKDLGGKLVLTVHDELLASAPKKNAPEVLRVMSDLMSDPYNWGPIKLKFPVPVTPDGSYGERWSEIH